MTERDYELLAYIHQHKELSIVHILRFPPSSSVAKERLDKLKELGYVRRRSDYYSLTPKGEVALEDYLLEQNRRQQPQEPSKKNYLPFGLTVKEIVLYLGFPLILMLVGFWLNS